jgi:hypothetical protein
MAKRTQVSKRLPGGRVTFLGGSRLGKMSVEQETENAIYFGFKYSSSIRISPSGKLLNNCTCLDFTIRQKPCKHLKAAFESESYKKFVEKITRRSAVKK